MCATLPMLRSRALGLGTDERREAPMVNSPGTRRCPPSRRPRATRRATGAALSTRAPPTRSTTSPASAPRCSSPTRCSCGAGTPTPYAALEAVAAEAGFQLVRDEADAARPRGSSSAPSSPTSSVADLEAVWVERVRLAPAHGPSRVGLPPDRHLAAAADLPRPGRPRLRAARRRRPRAPGQQPGIDPTPYTETAPVHRTRHPVHGHRTRTRTHASATPVTPRTRSSTPQAGCGGRQPVNWLGPAPHPRIAARRRRPPPGRRGLRLRRRQHPWLGDRHVHARPGGARRS